MSEKEGEKTTQEYLHTRHLHEEDESDKVHDIPQYFSGRTKGKGSILRTFIRISEVYAKLSKKQKFSLLEEIAAEFKLELKEEGKEAGK